MVDASAPDPRRLTGPGRATPITAALLQRVLKPYRDNCHYVQTATLQASGEPGGPRREAPDSWITIDGTCSIPVSCYIDDTGHFNAVELNITYNQLLYTALAAAARDRLIPELPWDLGAFFRHQLPDVLILDYQAKFPRPLDARAFRARFQIREVIPKPLKSMLLL